ncbi:MAG TPA: GAF domain-containing protein [Cyclobacteriaceae bacterium]
MPEELIIPKTFNKKETYELLFQQIKTLVQDEKDRIANMANIASALKYGFDFLWVGFYLVKDNQLILGPFQGPIACSRIAYDKGVCGKAWSKSQTIIVPDVNLFPGHIACSSESRSEIVVPILKNQEVIGVLDIDSSELNTFDETDQFFLDKICKLLISSI